MTTKWKLNEEILVSFRNEWNENSNFEFFHTFQNTNKQTNNLTSYSIIIIHSIQFSSQKQNKKEFILKEFLCMECVCLYARGSNICLNSIQKHLRQTQKKNILLTPLKLQPKNFLFIFFIIPCVLVCVKFFFRSKSTLAESIFNRSEWP